MKVKCIGSNPTITISSNSADIVSDFDKSNANLGTITTTIQLPSFNDYFSISIDPEEGAEEEIIDILKKHNWDIGGKEDVEDEDDVFDDYLPEDELGESWVSDVNKNGDPKKKKKTKNALLINPDYDVTKTELGKCPDGECEGGMCEGLDDEVDDMLGHLVEL